MIKLSDIQFPTYFSFRSPRGGAPKAIELHIRNDADFTGVFGERVKASGGRYSHCRGHATKRYVTIGMERGLGFACELADDIVDMFGQRRYLRSGGTVADRTVAILRGVGTKDGSFLAHMGGGTTGILDVLTRYVAVTEANAAALGWTTEPAPETAGERAKREAHEAAARAVEALSGLGIGGVASAHGVTLSTADVMKLIEAATAAKGE
jgi:hypothetical protein